MNGCSRFFASFAARLAGMDSPGNLAYALLSRRGADTAGREMPQKSRWESRYTEKSIVYGREACGGAWPVWIRPGIRPMPFCPGGERIPPTGACRRKADGKADIPRRIIVYGREACGGAWPAWIATENTRVGKSTALLYSSAVLLCPNTKGKKLKKTSLFPGNGRILIQLIGCRPAPPERSRTRTVSSDADIPSWKNGAL